MVTCVIAATTQLVEEGEKTVGGEVLPGSFESPATASSLTVPPVQSLPGLGADSAPAPPLAVPT